MSTSEGCDQRLMGSLLLQAFHDLERRTDGSGPQSTLNTRQNLSADNSKQLVLSFPPFFRSVQFRWSNAFHAALLSRLLYLKANKLVFFICGCLILRLSSPLSCVAVMSATLKLCCCCGCCCLFLMQRQLENCSLSVGLSICAFAGTGPEAGKARVMDHAEANQREFTTSLWDCSQNSYGQKVETQTPLYRNGKQTMQVQVMGVIGSGATARVFKGTG